MFSFNVITLSTITGPIFGFPTTPLPPDKIFDPNPVQVILHCYLF